MARTPSQYQEEYVAFIERDWDFEMDLSQFEDADTWMQHVTEIIFGPTGGEMSDAQQEFFEDTFGFFSEAIAGAGWRIDIGSNRFRDIETGRFVARADVTTFLRAFGLFGGLGGNELEI